jgi:N-acetylneuraminic acid mutarotase
MDNIWSIELKDLSEFIPGSSEYSPNPQWEKITINGNVKPPALSNHSSVVHKNKMYLFGGSSKESENITMYTLDLQLFRWVEVKAKAENDDPENLPHTRDEHSCILYGDSMIIFGGFSFGQRTNDVYAYNFNTNKWTWMAYEGKVAPCPRAGHSAVIKIDQTSGDCMYIFGGKDDDNNKLNDTWKFNLKTSTWTQISGYDEPPLPRSGHAA